MVANRSLLRGIESMTKLEPYRLYQRVNECLLSLSFRAAISSLFLLLSVPDIFHI